MRGPERSAGTCSAFPAGRGEALACLRAGRVGVRKAIDELAALASEQRGDLVVEAREQLLAAMHLIDGAGVALGRNGL